jgi:hypothetical protein
LRFQARVAGLKMEFAPQTPWQMGQLLPEFCATRKTSSSNRIAV